MLKFPDMSEKCIPYRVIKKQENGENFSGHKNQKL